MFIYYPKGREVIEYAASELAKYLRKMTPTLDVVPIPLGIVRAKNAITLGSLAELGLSEEGVQDSLIDDLMDIHVTNLSGYIAGSNDRSVLLGVYRCLTEAGCFWANATPEGEYVPQRDMREFSYTYRKLADHPFRGQCIEGAVSFTNLVDTIRWLPKVGMNMFMLEQVVPFNYISRWYDHTHNTKAEKETLSFEEISNMIPVLEAEVKHCGLQLHSLGHGYLLEPYGIRYKTRAFQYELSELARSHCAMVNGERKLEKGSPNFTQLCYSNPEARKKVVDFCVKYAQEKPYIDFLHLWLADSTNNQCECPECVKKTPSDFYVILLNEVEEAFRKNNIDMRIVFILYTDTLWAPETEQLAHPEQFTLLSTLSRNIYLGEVGMERTPKEEMPAFVRNSFKGKFSLPNMLTALDIWREQFHGPNFLYEYYLYTAQYNDPGSIMFSKAIYRDVQRNNMLGFSGIVCDQTQRAFFPTGFPAYLLSRVLFDKSLSYEDIVKEYFPAAFGNDGMEVYAYLEKLTKAFRPELLSRSDASVVEQDTGMARGATPIEKFVWQYHDEYAASLAEIPQIIKDFAPVIERNLAIQEQARAACWQYLKWHASLAEKLAKVIGLGARGRCDEMRVEAQNLIDYVSEIELNVQPVFDLCLFVQWLKQKVK